MVNLRNFTISDDLFSGFSWVVDLDECENLKNIIDTVSNALLNFLQTVSMVILVEKMKEKEFHIHDYTFEDILLNSSNQEYYICSHCEKNIN